jgi:hypothetical protein
VANFASAGTPVNKFSFDNCRKNSKFLVEKQFYLTRGRITDLGSLTALDGLIH